MSTTASARTTPKWAFDVVDRLAEHTHGAVDLHDRYQDLWRRADATTRFLLQLLLEDERRQQQLTVGLALAVSGDHHALPDVALIQDPTLVGSARALREAEENDRGALSELRESLLAVPESELWVLVVELLIADADRRIRILQFVERHAGP